MKIYIIGTGMDGASTLTAEALEKIRSADALIGAKRVLKPFEALGKPMLECWDTEEICGFIEKSNYENTAVLMSGDCGFYSGAEKLIGALRTYETEVICGISSAVYFCSKIKKPWQDMKFISLHGVTGNIVRNVCMNKFCFFLLGGDVDPSQLCKRLCEYGLQDISVYIGEALAYENEKIYRGKAGELTEISCGNLCAAVTENPDYEQGIQSGIDDKKFIRGKVPMTRSEVRSAVISKLNIGRKDICWDIGCGTGSLSVEMALQCYDGTVFAADKKEDAVLLTTENCKKFGCDNVRIICGDAPECTEKLPAPGKVFIGGSDGKIKEIITAAYLKNPAAEIVITAVSLETLETSLSAFKGFGIIPEVIQIAAARTERIGGHTMLAAENPVFIIKGVRT